MRIEVFEFQPFVSRRDRDTVWGLRFAYSRCLIAALKDALKAERGPGRPNPGGWLPDYRCWFVEPAVWPSVRHWLTAAGHTIDDDHLAAVEVKGDRK